MARLTLAICLCSSLLCGLPQKAHSSAPQGQANQQNNHTAQIPTPHKEPSPQSTAKQSETYTYNYYYPAVTSESPPVWFQEVATGILILFTGGLWVTSIWQWNAIRDQAEAAEAALHANRPEIIVTSVKPNVSIHPMTRKPDTLTGYVPQIYNLGSGPAEIVGIFTHTQVFEAYRQVADYVLPIPTEEPKIGDLIWDATTDQRPFPRGFLAPSESYNNHLAGYFPVVWVAADIEAVTTGEKRRAVYGLIKYRGSIKEYRTRFFYWWNPEKRIFTKADSPELNERT